MSHGIRLSSVYDRKAHPTHVVALVLKELEAEGAPAASALRGTGIELESLGDPLTRVSAKQTLAVFGNAMRLTKQPTFALRAGAHMHIAACGLYGYAIHCCSTHREALEFGARYNDILSPFAKLTVDITEDLVTEVVHVDPAIPPQHPLYRFIIEFKFKAIQTVQRDLYGPQFSTVSVDVAYDPPPYAGEYPKSFGCPVRFGQDKDRYSFSAALLNEPMRYSDPTTHAMLKQICDEALTRTGTLGGVAGVVQAVLMQKPGYFPDIEAVAKEIAMSTRTLRRKLEAENTSYREILAEVRKRLAIAYLRTTDLTNEEIASRLGYNDTSSFHTAFVRWLGMSPSEYKKTHVRL